MVPEPVATRSPIPDEILVQEVHDAISAVDANGILHTWNAGAERVLGYRADEVIGKHVSMLAFPEDRPKFYEDIIATVLNVGRVELTVRNRRKDGSEIYIALRLSVVRDSAGNVQHIIGCSNDITARKHAEDALCVEVREREKAQHALAASEARFRHLLEQSPAILYSCRASGDYGATFVGENAEALFGYPTSSFLSIPGFWVAHIHPDDLPKVSQKLEKQLDAGKTSIEYRFLHANGTYRWVRDSATLVTDAAGNRVELVGHMLDVTKEKEAEEERREHERLQYFSEALLTAQEEERKRVSRELHDDLNQRLAALIIEMGLMEKNPPRSAPEAKATCERLKGRVAEVSDEVRRIALQLHSAGLEQFGLAAALEHECMSVSERNGLKIDFKTGGVPEKVPNNLSLCLYRVAQECLRNIVKHSKSDDASVTLCGDDPRRIRLCVEDKGIGFDPMQARTRMSLGLISMNERLRQVNGTLTLTSKPGEGTKLEASVPFEH